MPAPRKCDPSGEWSRRQVALGSGVSLHTVNSLVRRGVLPETRLSAADQVIARVAEGLGADRPTTWRGLDEQSAPSSRRVLDAAALVRGWLATSSGSPGTYLLADSQRAWLVDQGWMLQRDVSLSSDAVTVLPVGRWAAELLGPTPVKEAA